MSFLFLILSYIFRTAAVKAKHNGTKGVNGASQNAQQAEPTAHHHSIPVIIAMRYGIHTSHDKTKNTEKNITMFVLSLNCLNNHTKKAFNLPHNLRSISAIFKEFCFFGFCEG